MGNQTEHHYLSNAKFSFNNVSMVVDGMTKYMRSGGNSEFASVNFPFRIYTATTKTRLRRTHIENTKGQSSVYRYGARDVTQGP
jgi:hypothetical protein